MPTTLMSPWPCHRVLVSSSVSFPVSALKESLVRPQVEGTGQGITILEFWVERALTLSDPILFRVDVALSVLAGALRGWRLDLYNQ